MDDAIMQGTTAIVVLLILGAIGVPVAFSMISVGIVGMWWVGGIDFMASALKTLPFQAVSDYAFAVIPMFIFMGALAAAAGITVELYDVFHRLLSRVRGGLYMATTVASGVFAAVSGSTIVNAAVFTRIALPEMIKHGYDKGASAGCIAAAGTFAALIPPSISLVVVAILTDASIGQLLMAGILPGLLTILIYVVGIAILVRIKPQWAPRQPQHYPFREQLAGLARLLPTLALIVIVLGGIYTGIMFPSSAGAVGAAGALLIALVRRRMSWMKLWDAIKSSAISTAVLFFIIIGGLLFSRFLTYSGFITEFSDMVAGWDMTLTQLMLVLCVFYVVLGMFVDPLSMMLVTIPFVFPVASGLGVDVIWFAVIVVKLVEIAAITPPVGLNLFAVISASDKSVGSAEIFRGIVPFVLMEFVVLGLLVAYPEISTWLPGQMN
ncbi:MAG: TRAP transporter large permease [Pusillimonas sp.]